MRDGALRCCTSFRSNMIGPGVRAEARVDVRGQWVASPKPQGSFFLGTPWFSRTQKERSNRRSGTTLQTMKQVFERSWTGTKTARVFFFTAPTLLRRWKAQAPLEGEIDPNGTVFFFGHFVPLGRDRLSRSRASRTSQSPGKVAYEGAAKAEVDRDRVLDCECPLPARVAPGPEAAHCCARRKAPVRYGKAAQWVCIHGGSDGRQSPDLRAHMARSRTCSGSTKRTVSKTHEKLSPLRSRVSPRGFAQDHDLDMAT